MRHLGPGRPNSGARLLIATTALVGTLLAPLRRWRRTPTPAGGVEEVVVTARARSEDIQNVPAQVTAFTASDIQNMGIQKPQDFLSAVPNVTFIETQNAGTSFLVMRGISQARNSPPSAAIVVDGVPMTQPAQFNQEMLDIAQIEVVKGPQGALYGRNAIGGAIIIKTQQPTDTWEGHITAGYESGPGGKVEGVISGPIAKDLKIRAAASYFKTDGHLKNYDTTDKIGQAQCRSGRGFQRPLHRALHAELALHRRSAAVDRPAEHAGALLCDPGFRYGPVQRSELRRPPINLNNSGQDARKIYDADLKLTYDADLRHLHLDHRLQFGVGNPDRRRLSVRSVRALSDQPHRLQLQPEPVPEGEDLHPGSAVHLAVRSSLPLYCRRADLPHQPLHLDRQHVRHQRRGRAGGILQTVPDGLSAARFDLVPVQTRRSSSPGRSISIRPSASPKNSNSRSMRATTAIIARTRPTRPRYS